ncbi:MAG: cytochrome c maturation protein CcmE [Chloroflexi bacterium]|nr:cytochrome c maturation protein CcmE [Chloroflexota bacterium]
MDIQKKEIKSKKKFVPNRILIGSIIMVLAVVILVATSARTSAQYYLTVDELVSGKSGRTADLRISGVVLGDSIYYDSGSGTLSFTIANIPGDNKEIEAAGGLARVLHEAAIDPANSRIDVAYHGERPDLLKNEAQAILTGSLGPGGVFVAEELLLKCPSRYEESLPAQVQP